MGGKIKQKKKQKGGGEGGLMKRNANINMNEWLRSQPEKRGNLFPVKPRTNIKPLTVKVKTAEFKTGRRSSSCWLLVFTYTSQTPRPRQQVADKNLDFARLTTAAALAPTVKQSEDDFI